MSIARRIGLALLIPALMMGPASAYPRPGRTERMSVAADGGEPAALSTNPLVAAGGRLAFFVTNASNVVSGDTNNNYDVFVRDRIEGTTEIASLTYDGSSIHGYALSPEVTPDGRYLVFSSGASNVVPGDTNATGDVFVRDLLTGEVERGSLAHDGDQGVYGSGGGRVSDDGRYVSFATGSPNMVPEKTTTNFDVFVRDRVNGTTERVSVGGDGAEGNAESYWHHLSGNGNRVAIETFASTLVPGDTNGVQDVVVRDRTTRTTVRASVASDGTQGNGTSNSARLSFDGRYVAFTSIATNLVPADANVASDVFVHDLVTGATERVSVDSSGREANDASFAPGITADGRYVAFQSLASNLVPGDTNGQTDTFIHDRVTGLTERVTVTDQGAEASPVSSAGSRPSLTADGRFVAFASNAPDLTPGDTNGTYDVFLRDRGPDVGPGGLEVEVQDQEARVSGWAAFSGIATSAADPDDDGQALGPVPAREVGGELTGARLVHRPEREDLLIRWDLAHLPGARAPAVGVEVGYAGSRIVPSAAGLPGVVYGIGFDVDGVRHQIRGTKPGVGVFELLRCDPSCEPVTLLDGSIGVSGVEARVAVPFQALGEPAGKMVRAVRAYSEVGHTRSGVRLLDEVLLPDVPLHRPTVLLGISPAGGESEPNFATDASLVEGRFEGTLDLSDLGPGDYRVWVRGCLGGACSETSAPLELPR